MTMGLPVGQTDWSKLLGQPGVQPDPSALSELQAQQISTGVNPPLGELPSQPVASAQAGQPDSAAVGQTPPTAETPKLTPEQQQLKADLDARAKRDEIRDKKDAKKEKWQKIMACATLALTLARTFGSKLFKA